MFFRIYSRLCPVCTWWYTPFSSVFALVRRTAWKQRWQFIKENKKEKKHALDQESEQESDQVFTLKNINQFYFQSLEIVSVMPVVSTNLDIYNKMCNSNLRFPFPSFLFLDVYLFFLVESVFFFLSYFLVFFYKFLPQVSHRQSWQSSGKSQEKTQYLMNTNKLKLIE